MFLYLQVELLNMDEVLVFVDKNMKGKGRRTKGKKGRFLRYFLLKNFIYTFATETILSRDVFPFFLDFPLGRLLFFFLSFLRVRVSLWKATWTISESFLIFDCAIKNAGRFHLRSVSSTEIVQPIKLALFRIYSFCEQYLLYIHYCHCVIVRIDVNSLEQRKMLLFNPSDNWISYTPVIK